MSYKSDKGKIKVYKYNEFYMFLQCDRPANFTSLEVLRNLSFAKPALQQPRARRRRMLTVVDEKRMTKGGQARKKSERTQLLTCSSQFTEICSVFPTTAVFSLYGEARSGFM